jgi:hypothetical protein
VLDTHTTSEYFVILVKKYITQGSWRYRKAHCTSVWCVCCGGPAAISYSV